MSIKYKLTISTILLIALIAGLVALSTISLQILTATDPNSPVAQYGLTRALWLILGFGAISILCSLWMLLRLPKAINRPFEDLAKGVNEVANHNYSVRLELTGSEEMKTLSDNFNRMAQRLEEHRHTSLAQIKTQKQYIETILASIDEPIICLGKDKTLLLINDMALQLLHLSKEDTIGMAAEQVAMHNDLLRRLLNGLEQFTQAQSQASTSDNLTQNQTTQSQSEQTSAPSATSTKNEPLKIYADNKESYFQVSYLPVKATALPHTQDTAHTQELQLAAALANSAQTPPQFKTALSTTTSPNGYIIALKNVTDFHRLDMAKTTFISTISHEMKTPLASILMSQQLLLDHRIGRLNDEQQELAESIKENGERLLTITGELLNMTQVESGVLHLSPHITKPIELIDYAIKANHVQADKFGINIEVDYPSEKMPKIYVDSEKIAWVLTNLLSNAIRYSAPNGRVIIGASLIDEHHLTLFVKDFGRGIDPRYHESIFERYFRVPGTKVQGSGLGLSISRDFVQAHGGTLRVESEVGKGSTFIVTLSI